MLQQWVYMAVTFIWISIMGSLFVLVKFKLWVDRNAFIKGIKV